MKRPPAGPTWNSLRPPRTFSASTAPGGSPYTLARRKRWVQDFSEQGSKRRSRESPLTLRPPMAILAAPRSWRKGWGVEAEWWEGGLGVVMTACAERAGPGEIRLFPAAGRCRSACVYICAGVFRATAGSCVCSCAYVCWLCSSTHWSMLYKQQFVCVYDTCMHFSFLFFFP